MAFRGDYQIQLIATDGSQLDLLSMTRIISLNYSKILNDIGEFTLIVDASDAIKEHFNRLDMLVNIWRRNVPMGDFELDASYLTRFWSRFESEDDNEEYIIFSGKSLEHLLFRRLIVPEDDPVNAGGFVTRNEPADTLMRNFVLYQCVTPAFNGVRTLPNLSAAAVAGSFLVNFQRRSYDNLLDILQEIAQSEQITPLDFRIVFAGDPELSTMTLEFQAATIGTDRTKTNNYPTGQYLLFDPRRGNLISPAITIDRKDEKTFAYVAGQGLEDERVIFPVLNAQPASESIWNRIETITDARNNEEGDVDGYLSAGIDALNDQKEKVNFEFTPDLNSPSARYNADWFLGDFVTAQYADFIEDVRIKRVTIDIQDDEHLEIEVTNNNLL